MARCAGGAVFAVLAAATVAYASSVDASVEKPYSFDTTKTVVPVAYRLNLRPDLRALTLSAEEQIDIIVRRPVRSITLNAVGLTFGRVTLVDARLKPVRIALQSDAQTATFIFASAIPAGRHTLAITYRAPITLAPSGLYYNDYNGAGGRKRMLVTQFESIDARRMFAGWDEPAFKATYTIAATLPAAYAAISNTPIAHRTGAGVDVAGAPLETTTFATTPKMSSYLVVLAAGDLRSVGSEAAGTAISVWSERGKEAQGNTALADASKILPYYDEYFGVPYPLPKLDLIAVPGNFAAGAMENWGGITFIDNDLLFDQRTSAMATREAVFDVVAHEMAHQWSGDLVTMAWWNDIWLNEGFASWMATKASDRFNPSWNVWLRARSDKETAMALDAHRTTHPIQQTIATEEDIDRAFDLIAYLKGQSFLRMIETYVGEDVFRDGMRAYMKQHAYSNTTTADLWSALGAASGKPVATIAAAFTQQPGVPLVLVNTACSRNSTTVTLAQDRFTINDPKAAKEAWQIPMRLVAFAPGAAPAAQSIILGPQGGSVLFGGCNLAVSANAGDTGYYRVQYDAPSLQALEARYAALPAADRLALIADRYPLVEAGRSDLASYFSLLEHLRGEREYAIWNNVVASFGQLDTLETGSPRQAPFRAYARSVLAPELDRLGWNTRSSDTASDALLRPEIIGALGRYDDPAVVAEARRRFAAYLRDPQSLDATVGNAVFTIVGQHADDSTWNQLHALGRAASGTELKLRYYYALASARSRNLIDRSVAIAMTNELPNGRVNRYLAVAAANSGDPQRVFSDVIAHYAAITGKLEKGQRDGLLPSIVRNSSDPALATELLAQPSTKSSGAAAYSASLAAAAIADNASLKAILDPQLAGSLDSTRLNARSAGKRSAHNPITTSVPAPPAITAP